MKQRKERGITLIALVITIIVLLILAGVSIATLTGENGILNKASKAKEEHLIEQYKEEINLIIIDEIAERKTQNKEELMIVSLDTKIRKKEWVNEIYKCNNNGEEQDTFEASTYLLVESKEHYQFLIEVDELNQTAKIVDFQKGTGEKYTVTYNANGGEGQEETIEVKQGFSVKLKECAYTRDQYKFVGWCENQNGEGDKYLGGSIYKPEGPVTLYAIWKRNVATITLNSNDGTENTEQVTVTKGEDSKLPTNPFIREGYELVEWNTQVDQLGSKYKEGDTINITEDITLYAIWRKKPVLAKNVLKPNSSATNAQDKSPFVKYNNIDCRVLYNDEKHGIQIITSKNYGEDIILGSGDNIGAEAKASDITYSGSATISMSDDFKIAAASYNNVVDNLNNKAKTYMDKKGIATDARSLGSDPTLTSNSKFQNDVSRMYAPSKVYTSLDPGWDGKFKSKDTRYEEDIKQLNDLGLNVNSEEKTWLASRAVIEYSDGMALQVRYVLSSGGVSTRELCRVYSSSINPSQSSQKYGFRPIFLIPSDIKIINGDGDSEHPYIIE